MSDKTQIRSAAGHRFALAKYLRFPHKDHIHHSLRCSRKKRIMFRSYTVPMTAQKPVGGEAPAGHPRPRAAIQGATVHRRYLSRRLELPILSRSAASATRVIAHPNPGRQRIFRLKIKKYHLFNGDLPRF